MPGSRECHCLRQKIMSVTAAALGGYRAAAEPVRRPSLFRFSRSFFGSWLGAEALVAGDFELRQKELMRRLDYGFAC
ncbi:uncharacterized protein DS421_11g321200 [Arachis hypogaea]|nr:uncharacterized protein DS421_11g321200 [Arachis hypogaea]